MSARMRTLIAILLASCGGNDRSRAPIVITDTIGADLAKRVKAPATVRCAYLLGMPTGCTATIGGSTIPLVIELRDRQWEWRFASVVIATAPIEQYIARELAARDVVRPVSCAPAIRVVTPSIECTLGGGGTAFVSLRDDGSVADLELELDPLAAAARSQTMPADELERISKALEKTVDEEDDDDAVPADAGREDLPP